MHTLLNDPSALVDRLLRVLNKEAGAVHLSGDMDGQAPSAVLVPLTMGGHGGMDNHGPCLVFNKRSRRVKQAGDLCFPGGRVMPRVDSWLSRILGIPPFPLARWPCWSSLKNRGGEESRNLALLLAASLRESLEEMRLNPLSVRFLGPLPPQSLVMFHRVIYPMVGWINGRKRFFPNWEVEKIVYIPLMDLLDRDRYACYRLDMGACGEGGPAVIRDFPCFLHQNLHEKEVLWGATYRITARFLELAFRFSPPPLESLPVIHGSLSGNYLTGEGGY